MPSRTLLLVSCLLWTGSAWAQEAPAPPKITPIELTLSPAAEPRPALRYNLAISPHERTCGNAATFYYRAMLERKSLPEEHRLAYIKKSTDWHTGPLENEVKEELKAWLNSLEGTFREIKLATYCDHCDWGIRLHELTGDDALNAGLGEVQQIRELSRAIDLRIKLAIAEKRYDDAIESLRWGYQLASHTARGHLTMNLVATAVAGVMSHRLGELMSAPDSPNMYWAIAALPHPFISRGNWVGFERGMLNAYLDTCLPSLKDAETATRSSNEWIAQVRNFFSDIKKLAEREGANAETLRQLNIPSEDELAGYLLKAHPIAEKGLLARGFSESQIGAMSTGQLVLVYFSRLARETYHQTLKLWLLPYPANVETAKEVLGALQAEQVADFKIGGMLSRLLLPETMTLISWDSRINVQLTALQTIEAIRMHVAATGQLPATLADIKAAPALPNPYTRQPFPYKLEGERAVLTVPVLPHESPHSERIYHLRIRK